jgi:hypothetical protein
VSHIFEEELNKHNTRFILSCNSFLYTFYRNHFVPKWNLFSQNETGGGRGETGKSKGERIKEKALC